MGFFDIFRKKNKKEEPVVEVQKGEYCSNENNYKYKLGEDNYVYLYIESKLELEGYSNLYKCELDYGRADRKGIWNTVDNQDIIGFNTVVIGLDKDKMFSDSNYEKYVLTELLNRDRILKLHNIEFGKAEGTKNGNYVGTVVDNDGNLSTFMDSELGSKIEDLDTTKAMRDSYFKSEEAMKQIKIKSAQDSIKREEEKKKQAASNIEYSNERIEALKKELADLVPEQQPQEEENTHRL